MVSLKNILPVTTVKKNLKKLLQQVDEERSPLVITRDGQAAGLLMSIKEYEGMLETMEILSHPKVLRALKKGEEDIKNGKLYSYKEVFS